MANSPNRDAPRFATIAAAWVIVAAAGLSAWSAAPQDNKAKAKKSLENLKTQSGSARQEKKAKPGNPSAKLPARPPRVVTAPTLTHEGLDILVERYLQSAKVPLAAATTDPEFVRRICLDITGKLPTPEQTRAFVLTHEKDKRAKLIEYLLRSDEYSHNWAHYWRDVVRFRATTNGNRIPYDELEDWLSEKLEANAPWDEIAKGIITATGRDDENGAVNFALSHEAQPVELAGEVSRIFLGIQIQCAQCHDHPNDSWKRQQFHEFAAYFAGVRRQSMKVVPGQRRITELLAPDKPARYQMPDKKDPTKNIFVAPKFFLDPKGETLAAGLTTAERLGMAASYVVGQDNPWFAKAFVNRIWYVLMGEGFYNPVDDMGPERTAKANEVIETLASEFQKGGYDIRWLFRTILNSRAYQREVRSTNTANGRTPFAAVCPSRLRSDQILDSLTQVLNLPDGRGNNGAMTKKGGLAKDLKETVGKKKGMARGGQRGDFNDLFGVDPSTPYEDILGTIPQALFLMNSPQLNNAMRAGGNTILGQVLAANPNNRAALNALYIRVLAREPTTREVQACGRYLDKVGNRQEAFEDILWSLINSTEFVTRR